MNGISFFVLAAGWLVAAGRVDSGWFLVLVRFLFERAHLMWVYKYKVKGQLGLMKGAVLHGRKTMASESDV